jgi:hypothetical protein
MRILTIRRIFALAAIGAAYVHGKRGGEWTIASVKDTLNYLWTTSTERIGSMKSMQSGGDSSVQRRPGSRTMGQGSSVGQGTSSGQSSSVGQGSSTSPGSSTGQSSSTSQGGSAPNGLAGDRMRRP